MIPQIVMVAMIFSSVLVTVWEHAKNKRTTGNAIGAMIVIAIQVWVLIAGGFFDKIMGR